MDTANHAALRIHSYRKEWVMDDESGRVTEIAIAIVSIFVGIGSSSLCLGFAAGISLMLVLAWMDSIEKAIVKAIKAKG
jgi:uncharacterized membrane protein